MICRLCNNFFETSEAINVCDTCGGKVDHMEHSGLKKVLYPGNKTLYCPRCGERDYVIGSELGGVWYWPLDCKKCGNHSSVTFGLWHSAKRVMKEPEPETPKRKYWEPS